MRPRKPTKQKKSNAQHNRPSQKEKTLTYYHGLTNVRSTVLVKGNKLVPWEEVVAVVTAEDFGKVVESEAARSWAEGKGTKVLKLNGHGGVKASEKAETGVKPAATGDVRGKSEEGKGS